MGRPPKHVRSATDTEALLFDAALTLFAGKGYAATTVREIIAAAGITQPTLYYHCRDKADLFCRLVQRHFESSHRQLKNVLDEIRGCEQRLRALVQRSFAYCMADPRIPRLMFQTYFGPPSPEVSDVLDRLTSKRFQLVRRLMREGMASGELKSSDEKFLALTFCCLMDQPINLFARKPQPGRYLTPALADAIVTQFLNGAGQPAAGKR